MTRDSRTDPAGMTIDRIAWVIATARRPSGLPYIVGADHEIRALAALVYDGVWHYDPSSDDAPSSDERRP
jgi:hypothetical protein